MKVMCVYTPAGPSYVRSGWGRVFAACGHKFVFWRPEVKSAFDAFSEQEPDLFIGTTYDLDRAVAKCIAARPHMKVALFGSAWGPYLNDIDLQRYPLVVTSEQEKRAIELLKKETGKPDLVFIHAHDRWLEGTMSGWGSIGVKYAGILNAADTFVYLNGRHRPELACDVAFVGGYWGYKARNLNTHMLPLCEAGRGLRVKIFGNQHWLVAQYLGGIDDADVKDLFVSATVCPNVSEPHSTDKGLGWDIIERPFKIASSGGFCVSDYVEEARDLFDENELPMADTPSRFHELVRFFVDNPGSRDNKRERFRRKVLTDHTYFERVADMLDALGMTKEVARVLQVKGEYLKGQLI